MSTERLLKNKSKNSKEFEDKQNQGCFGWYPPLTTD